MKKFLLYLSALLILLSIAGTALAQPSASVLMPKDIYIIPDGVSERTATVTVSDIAYTLLGSSQTRTISVETSGPNIEAKLTGNGADIDWTSARISDQYTAISPKDYTFTLTVRGTEAGIVTVSDNQGTTYSSSAASDATSVSGEIYVPEFPTVALPVAAILGLVFIFGRKKEEM